MILCAERMLSAVLLWSSISNGIIMHYMGLKYSIRRMESDALAALKMSIAMSANLKRFDANIQLIL